jgi:5'-methylthioadenosine phosphorylase
MIGFIGGSGLYELDGLEDVNERELETPFGKPSDAYICGRLGGREVCFLPRHGRGHRLLPSEINHRANIFGFKLLGTRCIVSISAVGSLREDHRPRDVVLPDQYVDRTKQSHAHTFFGNGIVAHVAFAEPGCAPLRGHLTEAVRAAATAGGRDVTVHVGGTYVNMEGPAFSTKAESNLYREQGFDVIGMTSLPEAKLCREAEICYQAMAMVTDYDCWHESEETVSVQLVLAHLIANTELARAVLPLLVSRLPDPVDWPCRLSLANAIMTRPDAIPAHTLARLRPIIGSYV